MTEALGHAPRTQETQQARLTEMRQIHGAALDAGFKMDKSNKGSTGIETLQRHLAEQTGKPMTADGIMGQRTVQTLKQLLQHGNADQIQALKTAVGPEGAAALQAMRSVLGDSVSRLAEPAATKEPNAAPVVDHQLTVDTKLQVEQPVQFTFDFRQGRVTSPFAQTLVSPLQSPIQTGPVVVKGDVVAKDEPVQKSTEAPPTVSADPVKSTPTFQPSAVTIDKAVQFLEGQAPNIAKANDFQRRMTTDVAAQRIHAVFSNPFTSDSDRMQAFTDRVTQAISQGDETALRAVIADLKALRPEGGAATVTPSHTEPKADPTVNATTSTVTTETPAQPSDVVTKAFTRLEGLAASITRSSPGTRNMLASAAEANVRVIAPSNEATEAMVKRISQAARHGDAEALRAIIAELRALKP